MEDRNPKEITVSKYVWKQKYSICFLIIVPLLYNKLILNLNFFNCELLI